jgi:DNA-binding LytR/AlgR family response regulator
MKLRCLLVDDEPPALKVLSAYAASIEGLELVGACRNAFEALEVLQRKHIDVIFLDIKMPRIIGTQFLRNLAHPPKVVFVTAYREYAVEGYELDAVDYLLKPVSFERFFKAITKLNRLLGNDSKDQPNTSHGLDESFVYLKVDRGMKKVYLANIEYIESAKDYIIVYLTDGINFMVRQSIGSIENLLSEHKFLRIHRSFIVSLSKIESFNTLTVQLAARELPIGRLYKQAVWDRLSRR